jgi:hypothetical protein
LDGSHVSDDAVFSGKCRLEISKIKLFYLEWRNLTNERGEAVALALVDLVLNSSPRWVLDVDESLAKVVFARFAAVLRELCDKAFQREGQEEMPQRSQRKPRVPVDVVVQCLA